MCAGITMYEPLCYYGMKEKKNQTVGIVGLGGLGTMGVKLAKALGHTVMVISTSANKEAMAKEKGADIFCVSTDPESLKANTGKCNLILNTVSADHDCMTYIGLLKAQGVLVQLGLVGTPHTVPQMPLMFQRKSLAGSLIGGIKRTQELLDLCGEKNVTPDIELIEAKQLDETWEKLDKMNTTAVRYVIDIEASKKNAEFMAKD